MKQRNKLIINISLLCAVLVVVFGTSYAIFTYVKPGVKNNVVVSGDFRLVFDEDQTEAITMLNAVPVSDAVGKTTKSYDFSLENIGTLNANYILKLEDDLKIITEEGDENNLVPHENIKVQLIKNKIADEPKLLSEFSDGQIDLGMLMPNEKNEYSLRLWIDSEATSVISGKHYHGIIKVEAYQQGITS